MEDLRIITTRGTDTVLDETTVQGFKTSVRGPLLRPGDAGYDEARIVWNGMIDQARAHRPLYWGRRRDPCRQFRPRNDLLVAVRGGGHNVAGTAVCDGGLMIDLSQMRSVHVDPSRRERPG